MGDRLLDGYYLASGLERPEEVGVPILNERTMTAWAFPNNKKLDKEGDKWKISFRLEKGVVGNGGQLVVLEANEVADVYREDGVVKVIKGLLVSTFTIEGENILREGSRKVLIADFFDGADEGLGTDDIREKEECGGDNDCMAYEPDPSIGVQMEWGVIMLPRIRYLEDVLAYCHEEWGHKYYPPGDEKGKFYMEANRLFMEVVDRAVTEPETENNMELTESEKQAIKLRLNEEYRAYMRVVRILKAGWGDRLIGGEWEEQVKLWANGHIMTYLNVANGLITRSAGIHPEEYVVK